MVYSVIDALLLNVLPVWIVGSTQVQEGVTGRCGSALLTLGFLLSSGPAATIVGLVLMHAAAVLHGMETTVRLPPHYSTLLPGS